MCKLSTLSSSPSSRKGSIQGGTLLKRPTKNVKDHRYDKTQCIPQAEINLFTREKNKALVIILLLTESRTEV